MTRVGRFVGAAALAVLFLAGCGQPPNPPSATVSKGDIAQTIHAAGTTVSASQAKLGFKVGGRLAKVSVAVGDTVTAGQVLAQLDTSDYDVALQQAQAA